MQVSDLPSRRPDPWQERAACKGVPTEVFFPAKDDEVGRTLALSYCHGNSQRPACPVRQQCLDAHIDERFGIWGGTSARQRVGLRARPLRTGICPHCGEPFTTPHPLQKFCSRSCTNRATSVRYRQRQAS